MFIKTVQREWFPDEMELLHDPNDNNKMKDRKHIHQKKHLLKGSSLYTV